MNKKTRIAATIFLGVALAGGAARAETAIKPETGTAVERADLLTLTKIGSLMQVVATEGARHGLALERSLFPGKGGEGWRREVARIQTPERLTPHIHQSLSEILRPDDYAAAAAFFETPLGQRIVEREVDARRAMLDGAVEQAARSASADLAEARTPRADLIDTLMDALDLVAANVTGGMNANFAFYRGLADGGALAKRLAEAEMLAMVRAQEKEIRASTEMWLHAYLVKAYEPLTNEELTRYLAFVETPAGQRYSAAMFEGFGRVFEQTSYDLGLAAARFMVSTDT
jgi:hypothetical protein